MIENRSTRLLAFVAGEFDMTFTTDVTIPLLKDVKTQAPKAVCELAPTYVSNNLIINPTAAPFNDPNIRKALALALDRKAFIDILSGGQDSISGVMLSPPEGIWGMPKDIIQTLPGYSADVEKSRAEARKIMEGLGYSEAKPLKVKISTRNIAIYRDPAVILTRQLTKIHLDGELEVVAPALDTPRSRAASTRSAPDLTGVGVDDPDVNLYENYSCNSERT